MQDKKLTVEDIGIPDTVKSAIDGLYAAGSHNHAIATEAVKVALLSLATNPVVPPEEVVDSLTPSDKGFVKRAIRNDVACACTEWQRRMFLRKPDPVPEEVKALLWKGTHQIQRPSHQVEHQHDSDVLAAFAFGKAHSNDTL